MTTVGASAGPGDLKRRLGVSGTVTVGLGSMIAAGVFAAFGPAAGAAGSRLPVTLVLAAVVAFCNAMSSARLAVRYPESGGPMCTAVSAWVTSEDIWPAGRSPSAGPRPALRWLCPSASTRGRVRPTLLRSPLW